MTQDQLEILQKATLTITHAGMNTTLECLSNAVPMVAIPIANDQPGVAARIAWTGAGAAIPLKRYKSFLPEYFHENLPKDFAGFWDDLLETKEDKLEYWSYWKHRKSWWQVRNLPNVLLVHYHNLIYDKSQEIDRISEFLNLNINTLKKEMILEKSSLEYMKSNWQKFQPLGVFQPNTFINKGVNGRWQNLLTTEQLKRYEIIISEELEPECAKWVKNAGFLPEVNSTAFD